MADLAGDDKAPRTLSSLFRRMSALEDLTKFLRSSRDLVGRATVEIGKELIIQGGLRVKRGGRITSEYPSGPDASYYGPLYRDLTGELVYGIAALDTSGSSIFTAYSRDDASDRGIVNGDAEWCDFIAYTQASMQRPDPSGGPPNVIRVDENGVLMQAVTGTHKMPGMGSTANAANLWIDVTNGDVKRSTSSRRYKTDITAAEVDLNQVLALVPKMFRTKDDVAEFGDDAPTHVGFIAEDAHNLGLSHWVTYNAQGQPEAFDYANFCVAQQAVIRDLAARVRALEGGV